MTAFSWSGFFRWKTIRHHVNRALDQPDAPNHLALSFSFGIFCSLLPVPGHTLIVTVLAYLFRLNIFAAVIGTWMNFPIILPLTYGFSFFVGSAVTGHSVPAILWSDVTDPGQWLPLFREFFLPMAVGTTIVGGVSAVVAYFLTLRLAQHLQSQRQREALLRSSRECVDEFAEKGLDEI